MHKKKHQFLNREISWLSFNARVLQEAEDKSVPLIERMRFLGIFSNNLDEFYKVRVASLNRANRLAAKVHDLGDYNPAETLREIHKIVSKQNQRFEQVFEQIRKELTSEGIQFVDEKKLTQQQQSFIENWFEKEVQPKLIPIRLQNKLPFPELKDSTIYFAIELGHTDSTSAPSYALLEIPGSLPRFVVLPPEKNKQYVMFLDDVIRCHLRKIFGVLSFDYARAYTVKIVRDAELDMDDDLSKSMMDKLSKSLSQRKKGVYVRLNYDEEISTNLLEFILKKIKIKDKESIIPGGRYHNKKDLVQFPDFNRKELSYKPLPVVRHSSLIKGESILAQLKKQDILLFFPYHPFGHVVDMLRECAIDPNVSTIRICLYRVAKQSQVVNALIAAARNGKKVEAVIEIQARFDEENNIEVARQLQEAGVRVIPGVQGLKVHSKIVLISRKEKGKLQRYSFIGTGNMHEKTAEKYSDITLMTARNEIGNELRKLFDFFETNFHRTTFRHLLVSPFNARRRMLDLINTEIENAQKGKPAWIQVKLNNLVDTQMIRKIYEAVDEGVRVDLSIRGTCCLVGNYNSRTKGIRARSIVGRYLEHGRVLAFCNNNKPLYFISSADWMTRNLDYRIEVGTPVQDPQLKLELQAFLDLQFRSDIKARILDQKFSNQYVEAQSGNKTRDFHEEMSSMLSTIKKQVSGLSKTHV